MVPVKWLFVDMDEELAYIKNDVEKQLENVSQKHV